MKNNRLVVNHELITAEDTRAKQRVLHHPNCWSPTGQQRLA